GPFAAPAPADRLERVDDLVTGVDHAGVVPVAVPVLRAVLVGDAPVRIHVRVLARVDVDRQPVGVLGERARPGRAAAVEGGGVVCTDGVAVACPVGFDRLP